MQLPVKPLENLKHSLEVLKKGKDEAPLSLPMYRRVCTPITFWQSVTSQRISRGQNHSFNNGCSGGLSWGLTQRQLHAFLSSRFRRRAAFLALGPPHTFATKQQA